MKIFIKRVDNLEIQLLFFKDSEVVFFDGLGFYKLGTENSISLEGFEELEYSKKNKDIYDIDDIRRQGSSTFFVRLFNRDIFIITNMIRGNEPSQVLQILKRRSLFDEVLMKPKNLLFDSFDKATKVKIENHRGNI